MTSLDRIDEADLVTALACRGLDAKEVLPDGAMIELPFEEAEVIDRTEALHREWKEVAHRACSLLGVDVGGVDLRGTREDFSVSPGQGGPAALLEVNVLPALHLHALPTRGDTQPVFEAFVAYCLQMRGAPPPCASVLV